MNNILSQRKDEKINLIRERSRPSETCVIRQSEGFEKPKIAASLDEKLRPTLS